MIILLATSVSEAWQSFRDTLAGGGAAVDFVPEGRAALDRLRRTPPGQACPVAVVCFDETLPDGAPLDLAREMLQVNAMVHAVVVSPLDDAAFHEAAEGLGVLLRLPPSPGGTEARALLEALRRLGGAWPSADEQAQGE